jgi:hypothetical protein
VVHAAGLEIVGEPVWVAEAFGGPTLGEFGATALDRCGCRTSSCLA